MAAAKKTRAGARAGTGTRTRNGAPKIITQVGKNRKAIEPVVDAEFRSLIPPLSAAELAGLRASLEAEGCRDALVCWNGVLLDGHNRLTLCRELGIAFYTTETGEVHDRDSAKLWILRNQFSRRNLTPYQRAELAIKAEPLIAAKAKERQRCGQGGILLPQNSAKAIDTREELAVNANVSHDTIARVKVLQQAAPVELLEKVRVGDVSINAAYQETVREQAKAERIEQIGTAAALPDTKYRIIYADPPWQYGREQHTSIGGVQETVISGHYPSMSLNELCALPVRDMALDDAVLFLWVTSPKLMEANRVIEAWGFTYKTSMVWDKVLHNVGYYVSVRHELLLICTRGACRPDVPTLRDSVYVEERTEHSRKPDYFRTLIDELYPNGKRIELFARGPAPEGWDTWGPEA